MKPKIFISHGEAEEAITHLVASVKVALGDDFEVKIDTEDMAKDAHDTPWPDVLDQWVAGCHGAVIFLDHRAKGRAWCQAEISFLMLRHRLEKLPVAVVNCGIERSKMPKILKETTRLLDDNWIDGSLPVEDIGAEIKVRFSELRPLVQDSPEASYVRKARHLLQPFDTHILRDAARHLGYGDEFDQWLPGWPQVTRLAHWILDHQDLIAVATALRALPFSYRSQRNLFLRWAAVLKIPLEAVDAIPVIARGQSRLHRGFGLRASSNDEFAEWQLHRPFKPECIFTYSVPCRDVSASAVPLACRVQEIITGETGDTAETFDADRNDILDAWAGQSLTRIFTFDATGIPLAELIELAKRFPELALCFHRCIVNGECDQVGVDWDEPTKTGLYRRFRLAHSDLQKVS